LLKQNFWYINTYMDQESLSYKTLKNSSFSFFGYTLPIVFSILVTPLIVHRLGLENYGLYVLINTASLLIGLLDLGLSSAFIKKLSQYQATGQNNKIKNLIYSCNSLFLIIGLVGFGIMAILGWFGNSIFGGDTAVPIFYLTAFLIGGLTFFVNNANSVYTITPKALQRFDIFTKIDLSHITIFSLLTIVLIFLKLGLIELLALQFSLALIFSFIYRHHSQKILPEVKLKFAWDKSEIISCYRFGLITMVSNISNSLLTYLDRLMIPIFLGPAQLPYYSLPGNVANHTQGVTNSLTAVIFPIASQLQSINNTEKIKELYVKSTRLITVLGAAITISIIAFSDKILYFWLGKNFATNSTKILIILALTYFLIALYRPLSSLLLGLGQTKFLSAFSVAIAIINFVALIILLKPWGIYGAAWAYFISVLPITIMIYLIEKKLLKLTGRTKYYFQTTIKIVLISLISLMIDWWLIRPLTTNILALIILGPLAVIIYLLLYRLFNFYEVEDWEKIKKFTLIIVKRLLKLPN